MVTLAERASHTVLAAQTCRGHDVGDNDVAETPIDKFHAVTFDNEKEFSAHKKIGVELKEEVYFSHTYHSRKRWLNEGSNGLLRQYFFKSMGLTEVAQDQVQKAVARLNHRPRKVLGYKTTFEVFFGKTMRLHQAATKRRALNLNPSNQII